MYNLCMGLCVNLPGFSVKRLHNYIDKQITTCNCVPHRKNALLILIGFKIVWDNVDSWDVHLAFPADFFAGVDDITKEREPGIEIIKHTP